MARIKIAKIAKELNLSLPQIFEFLRERGIEVDEQPNVRVDDDVVERLIHHFQPDRESKTCPNQQTTDRQQRATYPARRPAENGATPGEYDVFISYSRKDSAVADEITQALDAAGISYFIDRQGIHGAAEFLKVIADGITSSRAFLFLASRNSYDSLYTRKEVAFALDEKKNSILPYIIDDSQFPKDLKLIFSDINWRTRSLHPISTIVSDILAMTGRKHQEEIS